MKILKNAGTFEILIEPQNVVGNIAKVARTCYQSQDKKSPESDEKLVANLKKKQVFPKCCDSVFSRTFLKEIEHKLLEFQKLKSFWL